MPKAAAGCVEGALKDGTPFIGFFGVGWDIPEKLLKGFEGAPVFGTSVFLTIVGKADGLPKGLLLLDWNAAAGWDGAPNPPIRALGACIDCDAKGFGEAIG